ncbi:MAG: hypothetical protein K0S32_2832 [Bacteroidetes bacterium]|jgi:hypothetical protein|nr:hypothetical protein [Bacteroidota bacterium]
MYLKSKIIFGVCLLILVSCRKPEIPVQPLNRGDVLTSSVDMGPDYKHQLFYSLSQDKIISSNFKTEWDLAFECGSNGFHVKLNSSKLMCAFNTGVTDFSLVTDTAGFTPGKKFDYPTGHKDSTAFGNWQTNTPVYIVDRGYNSAGTHLGFRKLQIMSVNGNEYSVRTSNINGSNEVNVVLQKSNSENFTYFSFDSNFTINIDPGKEEFDLIFTQYTHLYFNPFESYLVTGVLSNPNKVKIAPVSDKLFNDITIADTTTHPFKGFENVIGFNWKTYSFQTSSYEIDTKMNYIIKDVKGFCYKLHFIDFYNSSGIKGCPKFEFKKL